MKIKADSKNYCPLLDIKKRNKESLGDYVKRFKMEVFKLKDVSKQIQMVAFQTGFKSIGFLFKLVMKPTKALGDLYV